MNAPSTPYAEPVATNAANTSAIAAWTSSSGSMIVWPSVVIDVPDRESEPQLAALRGGALGALQPAGHDVQLGLGHLRLEPQQQPIVEVLQVIDPVSVQHQGVGQRAELKQPQEVRVVARQPRDLQPENRADLAQTHPATSSL